MSALERGLTAIEQDLLRAHGRLVRQRHRRRRTALVAVAVAVALAAGTAALPAGRAAAAESIERLASVLGLRSDPGEPASLPAWIGAAPSVGASVPLEGSARELGSDGYQRLLTYRDAQTGGLCVVFGSFREECDRDARDTRWREAFAGTHVVLRGPWMSTAPMRVSEPDSSQFTTTLFGLVDDRVASVEVTMDDGTHVEAATPHGGFVVDRSPKPVAVVARAADGGVVQRLEIGPQGAACEPDCEPYTPTRILGHLAVLDTPPTAQTAPGVGARAQFREIESIPAPEVGGVRDDTIRRIRTGVRQGDMWLAATERGWVCLVFLGGICVDDFADEGPFLRQGSWDDGEPTVYFGLASDDVRRLRVTIGVDVYDVPIRDNTWVFVVPGRPSPEYVEPTSWELTLRDGRIITTGP